MLTTTTMTATDLIAHIFAGLILRADDLIGWKLPLGVLAETNDHAINTVRDYARTMGYDPAALLREEFHRIAWEGLDFAAYLKVRRIGSSFRLKRSIRRHVFAAYITRVAAKAAA